MSNAFTLTAENRSHAGKGASRRLRRLHNKVPGIIYGGEAEPVMVSLEMRELKKALETEAFYSHVLTLKLDGKEQQAVLRDLQRHPATGFPAHIDFLRVDQSHKITMVVPLHFTNEEKCIGVKKQGGEIHHNIAEVEVSCLPQNLPEYLTVDMTAVELDQVIHLSDVKLPAGVELTQLALGEDHDQPVAAVHTPKVRASADSDEEEAASGGDAEASDED
ncbi:50S ribosomal protein L25/general stress protein Ctc [Alloalcanivorax mobilis]|uniref:50S ribosomal protein L25/general stress protein Ctc n=1 Tax=Alloalcanivorax mobilis TaxID=2019569 RepID=UPI000B5B3058|nr:50S ribosomal protein L25/general stress protein Ctc [Alloalcanivorax mobilis]ASK34960.1 50S ribosomal protein L25/general stress protein Ctc [Alcanivorax sp. N3-2A]|tara:strand:+ start:9590 stop:10246 length:657 start_codon:yes stop_codon:yes gene_type:complete